MIRKVDIYRDENGREVKSFTDITGNGKTVFAGKVRVKVTPPPSMNNPSPVFERDFEFMMTDDITSVETAFERFDEMCKKRLDERTEKLAKKAVKAEAETPKEETPA